MDSVVSFAQVLSETGHLVYTIRGISMRPLLREAKDVVVIEKSEGPYKKYDTVLFMRENGDYILHRILRVQNDNYWIIGDNCISGEIVNTNQIIGLLISIKRGKHIVKVTDWKYKVYYHVWCDLLPVRFAYIRFRRFLYHLKTSMKRRFKQ